MKKISILTLSALAGLSLGFRANPPSADEIAKKMCDCGGKLAQVVEKEQALKEKDAYAYNQKLSAAAKEMLGCMGGMNYLESVGAATQTKSEQEALEQAVLKKLSTDCASVGKGLEQIR